jgi:septum formation protein
MLLLASSSPRRRALLSGAGFEFAVMSPPGEERFDTHLSLRELAAWNAVRKGLAVARNFPDRVVLAADTLVAFEGEIIGKPRDFAHAKEILARLSGNVHQVCTAVFLCRLADARSLSFAELSHVGFRRFNAKQIDAYLAKIDPLDKAGAYAAQGGGREIIAGIDGSFSNVVGLPLERTIPALREFGIELRPPA